MLKYKIYFRNPKKTDLHWPTVLWRTSLASADLVLPVLSSSVLSSAILLPWYSLPTSLWTSGSGYLSSCLVPISAAYFVASFWEIFFPWLTCAEAIFTWLWRWLRHRLSKRQSLTTVLLRTPITQMIFFNQANLTMTSAEHLALTSIPLISLKTNPSQILSNPFNL